MSDGDLSEYIKESANSLTQHRPEDSMDDWVTNFGVQIGFETLTANKTGFYESPSLSPLREADVKNTLLSITWLQIISR